MDTKLITRLRQNIQGYSAEQRRILMAIASSPFPLAVEPLRVLAHTLKIDLDDAEGLVAVLCSDDFFTSSWIPLRNPYSFRQAVFTPEALAAVLLEMKPEEITTRTYAKVYAQGRDADGERKAKDERFTSQWAELLEATVANRPLGIELEKEVRSEAMDRFLYIWLFFFQKGVKSKFLCSLPPELAEYIAFEAIWPLVQNNGPFEKARSVAERLEPMRLSETVRLQLADWLVFLKFWREGHLEERIAEMRSGSQNQYLLCVVQALQAGDSGLAMKAARKALKERCYCNVPYFRGAFENFIYGLALWADRQTPSTRKTLEALRKKCNSLADDEAVLGLFAVVALHAEQELKTEVFWPKLKNGTAPAAVCRAVGFALHITRLYRDEPSESDTEALQTVARDYPLFFAQWLASAYPQANELGEILKKLGMNKPLLAAERRVEAWESALQAMLDNTTAGAADAASGAASRVYYHLDMQSDRWRVVPRLQKTTNGRKWTSGRDIPLEDFAARDVEGMTAKDAEVASAVRAYTHWNGRIAHELSGARAILALAGCPLVFNAEKPDERLEIVKTPEQLQVRETSEGFEVKLSTEGASRIWGGGDCCAVRGPINGRIEVTEVTSEARRLEEGFKKAGKLPLAAKGLLTKLLERVSTRVPVASELLQHSQTMEKQKAATNLTVRILPEPNGCFDVRAVVRPLSDADVVCEPGRGLEYLAVNVDGRSVQVARNLKKERTALKALEDKIGFLDDCCREFARWDLDIEGCLRFLNAVRELKDIKVEWPQGEKLRVSHPTIGFANLNLSVNRVGAWLEVTGEVKVDGRTKLKVAELLEKVRNAKGSFITLGDNDYVALTDALRRELETLERIAGRGRTAKVSVFQSGVLSAMEEAGAALKADEAFHELRERLATAAAVNPQVPDALQAELRDYQTDGFEWMMRLAAWGAGALLADDMGLGKTVQTIAVLLARAQLGAQLVVVPASVLFNWREELVRFAPSLKQVILNDAADRQEVIKKAGAGAVVLTTYGILTAEAEAVAAKSWTTAVFDEAHNIKNRETKVFSAASSVQADFRVLLTGTPLQNHLSEIWALFEVAVPGLLGSFSNFAENFVMPVERDHDRAAQRLLKRLVSPFILRRTKTDVLSELPEKTEMTVKVGLSKEERALYESIREEAQGSLASGEINPVQALAYLLKLRQAACAAELVNPALTIPSSKTRAFLDLADDLIANKHRALVFSQFTGHLSLIRRALDEKGTKYLYLDGSTPPAERQKLVEQFDVGSVPLFLISLKAGGTGLNLTAADYVIHLDPWWNPAVEDQASDRAYRIGQERPVTIYRLIAEGTVEEKIIDLHGTKKSLADALLEGTEMSSRLGKDEILELLSLAR